MIYVLFSVILPSSSKKTLIICIDSQLFAVMGWVVVTSCEHNLCAPLHKKKTNWSIDHEIVYGVNRWHHRAIALLFESTIYQTPVESSCLSDTNPSTRKPRVQWLTPIFVNQTNKSFFLRSDQREGRRSMHPPLETIHQRNQAPSSVACCNVIDQQPALFLVNQIPSLRSDQREDRRFIRPPHIQQQPNVVPRYPSSMSTAKKGASPRWNIQKAVSLLHAVAFA
jgi:hypothetical protein